MKIQEQYCANCDEFDENGKRLKCYECYILSGEEDRDIEKAKKNGTYKY